MRLHSLGDSWMRLVQVVHWSYLVGIIAYGIGRSGDHVRASGWGPAFLDMGSGYDIGNQPIYIRLEMRARLWFSTIAVQREIIIHVSVGPLWEH